MESIDTVSTCAGAAKEGHDGKLLPLIFEPFPLGSIKPRGWLRDELQLMADGLAGHMFDFYAYVKDSPWLGGDQEYSGLNEGFPYWFNGLVPLAYGLNDERLKKQVNTALDYILEHQAEDGWIGPEKTREDRDLWGRFPVMLALMQLAEADPTQKERIVNAMHRFVNVMHDLLEDNYACFNTMWGRARSHDMILVLQWMYEKHPGFNKKRLWACMKMLNQVASDWAEWFSEDVYLKEDLDTVDERVWKKYFPFEHGVNAAQGLKAGAVIRRFTHNDSLLTSTHNGVNWTFEYHGTASGTIIGDERLVGLSPVRGSELCTAVELIYSLTYLYTSLGTSTFADRAELAAYNALPVMLTPDHWAHQYMVSANQPYSRNLSESHFHDVGTQAQTYGLEPHFPCCTVNHPQGLPKFVAGMFVKTDGGRGLAHALLGPAAVSTVLEGGNQVTVDCETNYPFSHTLKYTITASEPFTFHVRIPGWALPSSTISINRGREEQTTPSSDQGRGKVRRKNSLTNAATNTNIHQRLKTQTQNSPSNITNLEKELDDLTTHDEPLNHPTTPPTPLTPDIESGLHAIHLPAGTSSLKITLQTTLKTTPRANNTISIHPGALLYALPIAINSTSTLPKNYSSQTEYPSTYAPPQSLDHELLNASLWNVGIDPSTLKYHPPPPPPSSSSLLLIFSIIKLKLNLNLKSKIRYAITTDSIMELDPRK
ncbi:MAG: hypothetical protein M1812_004349 [Candelaria pacifica]|nr:MAG: hypothetical protein M1812_004349 [Candelaria pacifica]